MTLYVNKNTTNNFYLTLNERSPNTSPNAIYLMLIIGNENKDEKWIVLGQDTSLVPERRNLFVITDDANEDLNNQIVNFDQSSYDYQVWYSTTIDPDDKTILLEVGLINVNNITANPQTNYINTQNEYTYNG